MRRGQADSHEKPSVSVQKNSGPWAASVDVAARNAPTYIVALVHQSSEEHAPRWSMLEQRDDQVPVPVELRRSADDRHDAVGQREIEQRIDLRVGHPLREHAQRELRLELGSEPLPPSPLVDRERVGVEPIGVAAPK